MIGRYDESIADLLAADDVWLRFDTESDGTCWLTVGKGRFAVTCYRIA